MPIPLDRACGTASPFIGMVHLPPVHAAADVPRALGVAVRDARALAEGGVDAVLVENYGDAPFPKDRVAPHTVATLALAAREARDATRLPVGVNALRNDWRAAIGAAAAAGASFVRVNVLTGVVVTDQGLIEGDAAGVAAYRRALGVTDDVAVLADVFTKHGVPFPGVTLEQVAGDAWSRAGADALLVTGAGTGQAADAEDVTRVRAAARDAPVVIASGVTAANAGAWARVADGVIVGTALKEGGRLRAPVDPARVRRVADAWRAGVKARN